MRKGRATVLRLHLAVALLAGAGLLLVSVSGAALVFRPELHKVIGIASLAFHVPVALTGTLLALSTGPGPARSGSVEVRERDGSVARLDRQTGAVTIVRDPRPPGARLWALAATLHEGRFGGLPSRWLYVAAGLTPVALAITGLGIWLGGPPARSDLPLTLPAPLRSEGEGEET
jgi:uncharacterized iron-regulated membrane protein